MKLFKFTLGVYEAYGVFEDAQDAYNSRNKVDEQYDYLPVEITEVTVEGYEIILKPLNVIPEDRDELKAWLTERGIEFTPQLGTEKLKELAQQNL